jgi:hypothetical protein
MPGMSAGYVQAGFFTTPTGEIPDEVREQFGLVTSIAFASETVLLIAPRFPRGTPRERIAQDLHIGIKRMIDSGQLKAQSRATTEAMNLLPRYFQSVEIFKNVPLTLNERAADPTETAMQQPCFLP